MRVNREKRRQGVAVPPLLLDPANAQAWQGEYLLKLTPRAFAVLHYLSEHSGQLVAKDELMQAVWAERPS
jgi:DNA-binding winged helix-turn-helix (wHTH) protein